MHACIYIYIYACCRQIDFISYIPQYKVETCFHLAHKGARLYPPDDKTSSCQLGLSTLPTLKGLSNPHRLSPSPRSHCTHIAVYHLRPKRAFKPTQTLIFLSPKNIAPA